MWQRIQTLYLAIATALVVTLFFCVKSFMVGPGGAHIDEVKYISFIPYAILLVLTAILQVIALFTFNVRVLQSPSSRQLCFRCARQSCPRSSCSVFKVGWCLIT